jgi:excisionase family DNA binding protein
MTAAPDTGIRAIFTGQASGAMQHELPDATASQTSCARDDRRHIQRPPPSEAANLCRDQSSEFVTHLALALTRYGRHLRQDRLSIPPMIEELTALLVRCARVRPAATRMDEKKPTAQADAVAKPLLVTKAEAAEYLRVSVRTVERLIAGGQLPLLHIERSSRLRLADIEAYVDSLIPGDSTQCSGHTGERLGRRPR